MTQIHQPKVEGSPAALIEIAGFGLFGYVHLKADIPEADMQTIKRQGHYWRPAAEFELGGKTRTVSIARLVGFGLFLWALTPASLHDAKAQIQNDLNKLSLKCRAASVSGN